MEEDEEVDGTGEVGVGQALNEGEFQGSSVFGPLSGTSEFCLGLGLWGSRGISFALATPKAPVASRPGLVATREQGQVEGHLHGPQY